MTVDVADGTIELGKLPEELSAKAAAQAYFIRACLAGRETLMVIGSQ